MSGQFVLLSYIRVQAWDKSWGVTMAISPVCFVTVQVHTSQGALRAFFGLRKLEQKLKRSGRTPGGVSFCFPLPTVTTDRSPHTENSNKSRVLTSLHSGCFNYLSWWSCWDCERGSELRGTGTQGTACAIKVQQDPNMPFVWMSSVGMDFPIEHLSMWGLKKKLSARKDLSSLKVFQCKVLKGLFTYKLKFSYHLLHLPSYCS